MPYAPIGVAHFPTEGKFPGGQGNDNDVFIWSASTEKGMGPSGYTRVLQIPRVFAAAFARKYMVKVKYDCIPCSAISHVFPTLLQFCSLASNSLSKG
jgi:hypothetical protein